MGKADIPAQDELNVLRILCDFDGGMTASSIRDHFGVSGKRIEAALAELCRRGCVVIRSRAEPIAPNTKTKVHRLYYVPIVRIPASRRERGIRVMGVVR